MSDLREDRRRRPAQDREGDPARNGPFPAHDHHWVWGQCVTASRSFRPNLCLAVDSENPTGALGVYQRVGFVVESRWTNYVMTGEASASGAA